MATRYTQSCNTMISKLLTVLLVNVPIVALLSTVITTTDNALAFYAAWVYAVIVGLSGLITAVE